MGRKKRASSFMDGGGTDRSHSHRPASTGGGGSEFFICFTSRPSASSSAALGTASTRGASSSKSLLSPGRTRDPAPSLSASLSRRLRSSGSFKGAQSPMFPAVVASSAGRGGGERRKGCAFEAVEPSSPKVTCIGQVRVKSKKKKKAAAMAMAARSRSRRGGSRGEASFRQTDVIGGAGKECLPNKNQRWAYQLPVSICEALKAFGSEFSCFFPCGGRSFCSNSSTRSTGGRELEQCAGDSSGEKLPETSSSSCGAVIARWLMAIQDTEEGKRGEVVSVVVEERGEREMEVMIKERPSKQDFESKFEVRDTDEIWEFGGEEEKGEEKKVEEARVSICIPPPNALLLMRCRSDPVRMEALASRFWDSPAMKVHIERGGEENKVVVEEEIHGNDLADEVEVAAIVDSETKEGRAVDRKEKIIEEIAHGEGVFDGKGSVEGNKLDKKQQNTGKEWINENMGDAVEGTSACFPEMQRNGLEGREEAAAAAAAAATGAKAEIAGVMESSEEKVFADQVKWLEGEEKDEEETDVRRSSSCSSTMDKEDRRSSKCLPRAKESRRRRSSASREKDRRRHSISVEREVSRLSFTNEREARRSSFSIDSKKRWSFCIETEELRLEKKSVEEEDKKGEQESSSLQEQKQLKESIEVLNAKASEKVVELPTASKEEKEGISASNGSKGGIGVSILTEQQREKRSNQLPDCLLLMMYEPKLSMEVSKETWVCSTDFLRWHPNNAHQRSRLKGGGGGSAGELSKTELQAQDEGNENHNGIEKVVRAQVEHAPEPLPEKTSTIEKNDMDNAAAPLPKAAALPPAPAPSYGPFVLTRCKSEPLRSSASLAPDACFWRDRHRPIGATGIGF